SSGERVAGQVIDDLDVNVLVGAIDAQARLVGRAADALANDAVATLPTDRFLLWGVHVVPLLVPLSGAERLAGLAADYLFGVLDALAVVRLRLALGPDGGGELADRLLVRSGDLDVGAVDRDVDAGRDVHEDRVGKTDLKPDLLALDLRAPADADDVERLLVTLGH